MNMWKPPHIHGNYYFNTNDINNSDYKVPLYCTIVYYTVYGLIVNMHVTTDAALHQKAAVFQKRIPSTNPPF